MLESTRDSKQRDEEEYQAEIDRMTLSLQESESAQKRALKELTAELDDASQQISQLRHQLENADQANAGYSRDDEELDLLNDRVRELLKRCSDLESENTSLAEEIGDLRIKNSQNASVVQPLPESMTWEQRKAAIMAQLTREEEDGDNDPVETDSLRQMIENTDREVRRRDEEIAELRQLLDQQSTTIGSSNNSGEMVSVGAAGIADLFDTDELLSEEREKLREIQQELNDKLRQAEVELSLERAELARGRREIEQKQIELEDQLRRHERDLERNQSDDEIDDKSSSSKHRWLRKLGLYYKIVSAVKTAVNYFLRWRIRARIRRFFRPTLRRPLPDFFVPTEAQLPKNVNEILSFGRILESGGV